MKIALILTGGSGTRMAPITKTLNKGLVPIDGLPALERIILQLEQANIDKIIVLAGYLSWQVEFLLDIRSKFLKPAVIVSTTAPEISPADRLIETSEMWMNATEVVLIYCDNVFQDAEIAKYLNSSDSQRVLLHKRTPGNVSIQGLGQVNYSVNKSDKCTFVELGYWVLKPVTFFNFLIKNKDLQKTLQELTSVETVYHYEIKDYRTLSDLSRYAQERLRNRRTIFLDRDGVIIKGIPRGEYVNNINQISFIQDNMEFFHHLSSKYEVDFIVVTNQAGVERSIITMDQVNEIDRHIAIKLLGVGVPILAFYVCPHHWDSKCECRKPKPGMLEQAIRDFNLDPNSCMLIGDRDSDIQAGRALGIRSFMIAENMSRAEVLEVKARIENFIRNVNPKFAEKNKEV